MNDLFKWTKDDTKKEKQYESTSLNYWQKRTTMAAEDAVKCANGIQFTNGASLVNEEVYEEAQQIVRGWLTEQKIYGPNSNRESFLNLSSEEPFYQPNKIEIHKEWEHLIKKLESKEDYQEEIKALTENDYRDMSEDKQLHAVMKNLQNKSFVKLSKLRSIDSPKQIDVVKKMENRQDQVKKKREDRLRYEEVQRMNKLAEKEARSEAMKMLKEEKQKKEYSKKREEELIQMEMLRIRAEIQSQREEESKERERTYKSARDDSKREIKVKTTASSTRGIKNNDESINHERFRLISDIVEKKFVNKNLTILRRCFQLWRDVSEKRKIEMKKAAMWSAWQITRKVFKVWRRDARLSTINRKIELDQERLRHIQRNEDMALSFWKRTILKKCLLHWGLYVVNEKENKWFEKLEAMRKVKMVKYIDVLQEKVMENQRKLNLLSFGSNQLVDKEIQETEIKCSYPTAIESERAHSSSMEESQSRSRHSSARSVNKSFKVPKEPWQVTKKHVYLPIDQLIDTPNEDLQESNNFKALRPPKVVNNYANRNAAQKELIEQQRAKLQEQERLINELVNNNVLHIVHEDSSSSTPLESNRVRLKSPNEAYHDGNDEGKESIPKKLNKFVLQMEERAKERERIKSERLEKQKKLEEDKRKILAEQIAEQCRLDAEEKQKREQLLKEKREKDKLHEEFKRRNIQIEQDKNNKADQFYKSLLLKHYGINMWKKLIEIKEDYLRLADDYYKKKILKNVIQGWSADVRNHRTNQNNVINSFYSKMLLKRCFHHFRIIKERILILEQQAHSHYLETLQKKMFQTWRLSNHRSQIRLDKLDILSKRLYQRHLLKSCFNIWKQLPVASRAERLRERRKEIMRQKVAAIIPDFKKDF